MGKLLPLALLALGLLGLVAAMAGSAYASDDNLEYRAFVPGISGGEVPTPTPEPLPEPTPRPEVYAGPVKSLYLASARLYGDAVVEPRGTEVTGGRDFFQTPTTPYRIAWYAAFGHLGNGGSNSIFGAHIDYMGIGRVVFGFLTSARPGDALYVTMEEGNDYAYTVTSIEIKKLVDIDMGPIVYPDLDEHTERVTLISCGGTFSPYPDGGGEYDSRVFLVAERYVP